MKSLFFCLLLLCECKAATWNEFVHAIHMTETSGHLGPILGDNGHALGPLQLHKYYWIDAGVGGQYKDVADLQFASKTMRAYLNRYCHNALISSDWETCARTHNGGPQGAKRNDTIPYWNKVKKHLTKP